MDRSLSNRELVTAENIKSLFVDNNILSKGYNMPSHGGLEMIAATVNSLRSQPQGDQKQSRAKLKELIDIAHKFSGSIDLLEDCNDSYTLLAFNWVQGFVADNGASLPAFRKDLDILLQSLERAASLIDSHTSSVPWHAFVGRLEYVFHSAMRSTNDKIIGRKEDTGPLPRFLEAIIFMISGDRVIGATAIRKLDRSTPKPKLLPAPRLPPSFSGRGGDRKE